MRCLPHVAPWRRGSNATIQGCSNPSVKAAASAPPRQQAEQAQAGAEAEPHGGLGDGDHGDVKHRPRRIESS